MTMPLSATVLGDANIFLRIWFSPDGSSFMQLSPDERIASIPCALNAQTLDGLKASAFVAQSQLTTTLAAGAYITPGLAQFRYARSPTTPQLVRLKWYTAISGTRADFG